MIHNTRPLHRRPRVERQVLAILRGGTEDGGGTATGLGAEPGPTCFLRLRTLAARQALVILPADTPYLGQDELTLLSWIAAAQRVGNAHGRPADRCLAAVVERCARVLGARGLRLYPFTLYSHHLRDL